MLERIRALVADFRAFSRELDAYREDQRLKAEQAYRPLEEPEDIVIGLTTSSRGENWN